MIDFIFQIIGHIGIIIFIVLNVTLFYRPVIFTYKKEVDEKTSKENFIYSETIKRIFKNTLLMSAFAAILVYYNLVRVLKLTALLIQFSKGA